MLQRGVPPVKMKNGKWKMENQSLTRFGTLIAVGLMAGMLSIGCSDKSAEPTREAHPAGWTDTASVDFHGKYLATRGMAAGLANCRECHGPDSSVAATGVSCYGCHNQFPHPTGWSGPNTANLHQIALQKANWNMKSCQACHGTDYATVKMKADSSLVSCITCHSSRNGPQNCRVCHGSTESSAPPADLLGGTSTDLVTVGAHQVHLNGRRISTGMSCDECHAFNGFSDPNHIDTTSPGVAEVVFGAVATDSGRVSPVWDRNTGSCSSVYCHGSFDGGRDTLKVLWTRGENQAECGSCHSTPPPAPHPASDRCISCHLYTAATHVNGVVDMK